MINIIWFFMIFIGFFLSFLNGSTDAVTNAAMKGGAAAVELTIGLMGIICIWCGVMKIAEKSGLTDIIGKILTPFLKLIFPGIPSGHPAMSAIIMNMASNMLGLSNAATPFGIKAMEELQKINANKDKATNSMVMFLVINSACLQLIPATIISLRAAAGSKNPSEIIFTTIMSTVIAAAVGFISCKLLEKSYE
ncbi:spore maturation protein A [Oxobacter pfennigii]|uniref:Spore maturation protein A n=1 Tax=Oxobacter pfennigii TaxID=36849 RepID=A0A0P9AD90_9CLOT|nr:nucleoside recognition domain-containing protein [Oxobacter pfennigii]KPU43077.1 spore maturation protein A [Oxobacter pfennigii]